MLLFIAVTLGMTTRCLNFNTSHVTVYQSGSPYLSTVPRFQYISCYCLSDSHCMSLETQWYFNTSHVTVYHNLLSVYYSANHHFNTSHVTVYRRYREPASNIVTDFNTSHVTVYQQPTTFSGVGLLFQYISCYCLSVVQHLFDCFFFISIHLMLLFILLPHLPHVFLRIISIHLMLLFILVLPQGSPFVLHFNTSHVTVYHGAQSNIVSIHADFNTSHVTVYHCKT